MKQRLTRTLLDLSLAVGFALGHGAIARGQDLLPRGVGLYQLGHRSYDTQTHTYDGEGTLVPLGERFTRDFSGDTLSSGTAGPELKQLVDELSKYEAGQTGAGTLADQLDLGRLEGDVQADVKATFLGLAFGVADKLTIFAGVPYVDAQVHTELKFSGGNNAQLIKRQLGDLAYQELQDGLDRASRLNAAQVQTNIENAGYEPVEEWSHKGFGDARLGAQTGLERRLSRSSKYGLGLTAEVIIPTGYVEDPDILTDVSLGKGYYSLVLGTAQRLTVFHHAFVGVDAAYGENFPTRLDKRLPEGEENLVAADRRTTVELLPGDDVDTAVSLGASFSMLEASYGLGLKRHFSDTYKGELEGNYAKLAETSASSQLYQQARLTFTSAKAYQRGDFPVPFMLSFGAHKPIEARNSPDETWYEISLASFFSTPMAKSAKELRREARQKKKRQKRRRAERRRRQGPSAYSAFYGY